jgi:hypothetical protein
LRFAAGLTARCQWHRLLGLAAFAEPPEPGGSVRLSDDQTYGHEIGDL